MARSITTRAGFASTGRSGWRKPLTYMAAWWAAASERRQLAALDDNSLNDLGISKAQARAEAARRPWDLPEHLAREIEGRPAVRRRWR